jgi:hypothetical protein
MRNLQEKIETNVQPLKISNMDKMHQITDIIDNNNVVDLEIVTEPTMNKRGNPYIGRVKRHTAYLGVDFGKSYTEEVNRRRAEEGKTADFKAKKSLYEEVNAYFVRHGSQLYLRYMLKADAKPCDPIYEVDGRPATKQEVKEIESFYPKKNTSNNQGLEKGNEVVFRVTKIENIVALGGETWEKEV